MGTFFCCCGTGMLWHHAAVWEQSVPTRNEISNLQKYHTAAVKGQLEWMVLQEMVVYAHAEHPCFLALQKRHSVFSSSHGSIVFSQGWPATSISRGFFFLKPVLERERERTGKIPEAGLTSNCRLKSFFFIRGRGGCAITARGSWTRDGTLN